MYLKTVILRGKLETVFNLGFLAIFLYYFTDLIFPGYHFSSYLFVRKHVFNEVTHAYVLWWLCLAFTGYCCSIC